MTNRQTKIISILTIIVVILAFLVSSRYWRRFDLTRAKAYTLSEVSRNLYREIPDPVHITYYLSDKLRNAYPAVNEIEDTLREYAAFSRGRIILAVRDPVKSGISVSAEEYGIMPQQMPSIEQDQASIITVYSGIVIEYLDKIEVIPWISSVDSLEYAVTSRILAMVNNTERVIGIIVGDTYRTLREDYGYLEMILADAGFRIREIFPGEEIPDNLPGLFVLGGVEGLDDWALYRIDRYIQLGGRVFFAVNSIYIDTYYGSLQAMYQDDLGLLNMLASYGVIVKEQLVLDRNALPMDYQSAVSGSWQTRRIRYPLWVGVLPENGNTKHSISASFNGLDLYWPNPLELVPPADVQADVLFTSTPEAWLETEEFYTNPDILYMLEIEAPLTKGTKILGAALTGQFPSYFRGTDKPEREGSEEELPDMPEYGSFSRIIAVGDLEFATTMIGATQAVHNLDFLLRAADWLVNDDDIIGIRNRQPQLGRFDKISDPLQRAAAMRFSQILNVILIPLFVIITGLVLMSKRRRRSKRSETGYANVIVNSENVNIDREASDGV